MINIYLIEWIFVALYNFTSSIMKEKTFLEIGIYVAIVAFLLTVIALVDTIKDGGGVKGVSHIIVEMVEG